jgi:DNA-binding transcriptional ArsR family regulator
MSNGSSSAGPNAAIFAALGDATRLGLVVKLAGGGPMSIARLTEGTNVTRQAVAKHLRVLELAGLAHGTRSGRDRVWEIDRNRLEDARHWLREIESQWDEALARLKKFVEE